MGRVMRIGKAIGSGGRLVGRLAVEYLRFKSSASKASKAFEASLLAEGLPDGVAKELTNELLQMIPKLSDLRRSRRSDTEHGQGFDLDITVPVLGDVGEWMPDLNKRSG